MAETETHDASEDILKGVGKTTKALNGHSNPLENPEEKTECGDKMENGEAAVGSPKSPQINGEIGGGKNSLEAKFDSPKTEVSCSVNKESGDVALSRENKDVPENGKADVKDGVPSDSPMDWDDNSDATPVASDKKDLQTSDTNNKSVNCESSELSVSESKDKVSNSNDRLESESKEGTPPTAPPPTVDADSSQLKTAQKSPPPTPSSQDSERKPEEAADKSPERLKESNDTPAESKKDPGAVDEAPEEPKATPDAEKSSNDIEMIDDTPDSPKAPDALPKEKGTPPPDPKEPDLTPEDKEAAPDATASKEGVPSSDSEGPKDLTKPASSEGEAGSPEKEGASPKKKEDAGGLPKPPIVKRVTRSSSGVCKPVKYVDPDPRVSEEEDDDIEIEITKEVKKNDEDDDIEMIEESDPLAISDADVKRAAKEATKTVRAPILQDHRIKNMKPREHQSHKSKDQSNNVIIIDTNTLLKGQQQGGGGGGGGGSSSVGVGGVISSPAHPIPQKATPPSVSASAQTMGSGNNTAANIQTAIQAITGGNPAIQGLQSAYLNAIQQVLVAQGGSQASNPHYIATLQQYYNTLGALQDDAYVIEAPSFIVPYVMEGKPVDSIKDFLVRINKELEEHEKKREEELKKKKEEEAAKEKEEREKKEKEEAEKEKEEKKAESKEKETEKESEGESKEEESSKKEEVITDKKEEEKEEDGDEKMEVDEEEKEKETTTTTEDTKVEESKSSETEEKDKAKTKEKHDEDDDKENKKEEEKKNDIEEVIDLDSEAKEDMSHLGRWEGYYKSALGKFFLELGLSHAQEFIQSDLLRMQKRRLEKLKTNPTRQDVISVKSLERQLNVSKERNAHLYIPMKTCRFCSFKTESGLVMERHLESPHMVNYTYKCNFCEFETRGPQVILFHTEAEHNIRGRLERAPAFFQCPLCPFEDNNKSKMTRHSFSCTKKFKADKNSDLPDWEPPAKIPKIHRGRPNSFGKTFDALKVPNLLPKNLGGLSLNLQNAISSGLLGTASNVSANANAIAGRGRGRPVGSYKNITQNVGNRTGSLMYANRGSSLLQPIQGVTSAQQLSLANQVLQSVTQGGSSRVPRILPASSAGSLIPGLAASSSITIQSVQNKSGNSKSPQQPSISITPLPRGGTQSSGTKSTPQNASSNNSSQRPSFVICEICDGYIKDLEQLRNHMNLIHKVKIHPKMIYNRPPLNCQKCQHRFFTDQGLERHLLGTHGLVTSSMQEAANKGKDAGRCPICGKVFQWKLLNHVSRDHKMTLKPAHLSYKCTVCTATFNMYRLFENHVYSAHSVVNKNKTADGAPSSNSASPAAAKKPAPETPLKINDEITIIPQPASKSPKTESKTSPKKSESPAMSKEITITKVGSRSSRRSGSGGAGGVEVISLDDSPQKRSSEESPKRGSDEPPKKRTRETATSKRARTST